MFCRKCGQENPNGTMYCTNCGNPMQEVQNAPPVAQGGASGIPSGADYTPISMWGYFGYELLFSIPCIGFIILLIFSFGGTKNINVRNFARSYFCLLIVMTILIVIIGVLSGGLAAFDSLR